ncbi:hypothetical protein DM860_009178 [Cuscuta australis]|uniref:BED-type domain-containing protein n=1 Tax=Cuscuta australis TaxID=267555 RepID=A0A328DEK9_9ASTE|nr:hypothetical protein DM860_009178 [Cuscuta australis]
MTANGHDYGALVDRKKGRYQCNYCGKLITGHTRLKYHLGGIRGDVTPCPEVPEGVKETLRDELLEKKFVKARKDFGELSLPNLPLKRQRHELDKQDVVQSSRNGRSVKPKSEMGSLFENNFKAAAASVFPDDGQVDSPLGEAQKCIGRFFYETGVDFEMSESPSFLNMIRSINRTVRIPTCQQLKGQVLQDAVNEMQEYTSDIKSVWAATGCSILLDGWVDSNGRKLLNILIDCAKGTIYHQCSDISSIDDDVAEMEAYLGGVIEEVGVDNVVQIVTYSSSSFMEDIGKRINDKYKTVFWTVSASHCIELMLRKLETMKDLKEILAKAKTITEFVYDNESVLKLVRDFCSSDDLVEPSKIRSIVPFLTLENMIEEYRMSKGLFGIGSGEARLRNTHPALWWSEYGTQCPELQKLAVRILSQTCDGASKYNLKRTLAEALLTEGRNETEQVKLRDLAFVHYNMQLQSFREHASSKLPDEETGPADDDWSVVGKRPPSSTVIENCEAQDSDSEDDNEPHL